MNGLPAIKPEDLAYFGELQNAVNEDELTAEELKVSFDIRKRYKGTTVYDLTDKIISILERTKDNEAFMRKFIDKYKAQNI